MKPKKFIQNTFGEELIWEIDKNELVSLSWDDGTMEGGYFTLYLHEILEAVKELSD